MRGLRRAGQHGEDHVRARQQLVEPVGGVQLVHALRLFAGAALEADDRRAEGLGHARVVQPDVSEPDHKHRRVRDAGHGPARAPDVRVLPVAVERQLLLQREGHGEAVLGHGLAVGARGVAEQHVLAQHAGLEIGVRARGVELEEPQLRSPGDQRGGDVADDDLGPGDLLRAHLLRQRVEELPAGGRGLQHVFMPLLHRQHDEDLFHGNTSFVESDLRLSRRKPPPA